MRETKKSKKHYVIFRYGHETKEPLLLRDTMKVAKSIVDKALNEKILTSSWLGFEIVEFIDGIPSKHTVCAYHESTGIDRWDFKGASSDRKWWKRFRELVESVEKV